MGVVDVVDGLGLGFERSGDLLGLQAGCWHGDEARRDGARAGGVGRTPDCGAGDAFLASSQTENPERPQPEEVCDDQQDDRRLPSVMGEVAQAIAASW
jgi:hypothetical protein